MSPPDTTYKRLCCTTCRGIYRSGFLCCPFDGAELAPFATDPMVGTTLGDNYVIDECIGEGAMGRVYRAHHVRLARKQFAIKVLLGDMAADLTMRRRFIQEAEAASRLDHANVVSVLDVGESPEKLLYLVMEYVRGETLADLITRRGRLEQDQVIALSQQLCLGLLHAEQNALVHRDFKPENVALVESERGLIPRILDFGLAIISDPNDSATRLTQAGMLVGTPAYVSPEQATCGTIDHRTDLFALGVVMYEMLAGVLPFEGNVTTLLHANTNRTAPTFAERVDGLVVSPTLERIVRKLMAKDPDARFQSASEVLTALDAVTMEVSAKLSRPTLPLMSAVHAGTQGDRSSASIASSRVAPSTADQQTNAFAPQAPAETDATTADKSHALIAPGRTRQRWVAVLCAVAVLISALFLTRMRLRDETSTKQPVISKISTAESNTRARHDSTLEGQASALSVVEEDSTSADADLKPVAIAANPNPANQPDITEASELSRAAKTNRRASKIVDTRNEISGSRGRRRPARASRATNPRLASVQRAADSQPQIAVDSPPPTTEKTESTPLAAPAGELGRLQLKPGTLPTPPPLERFPVLSPKPNVEPAPRPPLDATASIISFHSRGSLSMRTVRREVDRAAPDFQRCYRRAARSAGRDGADTLSIQFTIDENARARDVRVAATMLPGLSSCIRASLTTLRTRVAPDVGTVKVSFSVRFSLAEVK